MKLIDFGNELSNSDEETFKKEIEYRKKYLDNGGNKQNIMPPAPKKKVPKRKSFDSESSDKKSNSDKNQNHHYLVKIDNNKSYLLN